LNIKDKISKYGRFFKINKPDKEGKVSKFFYLILRLDELRGSTVPVHASLTEVTPKVD
jgi:hypothetical protein